MKLAKYIVFIAVLIASVVFIIQLDDLNISNDGEPIKNVPLSLKNDGHKVLEESPVGVDRKHFKILIEKRDG